MPTSSKSPMLTPVPFTEADWDVMGWPGIASRFVSDKEDCYTPPSHTASITQTKYKYEGESTQSECLIIKIHFRVPTGLHSID